MGHQPPTPYRPPSDLHKKSKPLEVRTGEDRKASIYRCSYHLGYNIKLEDCISYGAYEPMCELDTWKWRLTLYGAVVLAEKWTGTCPRKKSRKPEMVVSGKWSAEHLAAAEAEVGMSSPVRPQGITVWGESGTEVETVQINLGNGTTIWRSYPRPTMPPPRPDPCRSAAIPQHVADAMPSGMIVLPSAPVKARLTPLARSLRLGIVALCISLPIVISGVDRAQHQTHHREAEMMRLRQNNVIDGERQQAQAMDQLLTQIQREIKRGRR